MTWASPVLHIEPRIRRIVSLSIAIGGLVSLSAGLWSLSAGFFERRDEIDVLRTDVDRLKQRTAMLAVAQPRSAPNSSSVDFLASDPDTASTHLQTTLRGLPEALGTTDIRIDSVRILPPLPEGSATAVRASVSLSAPGRRVFDVINALEASKPPIVIDSLRVISRTTSNGGRLRDQSGPNLAKSELTLALRIYARPRVPTDPAKQAGRQAARGEERQ